MIPRAIFPFIGVSSLAPAAPGAFIPDGRTSAMRRGAGGDRLSPLV
jgi:hypothetical protein